MEFCVGSHLRKVIHIRLKCDLGVVTWTSPPSDSSNSLIGNWPSHWDQSVCWSSGIFINSLCFSVALISWRRGVWGMNRWIIYLSGVKGHGMAVRVGIAWYSQRWRDLRLYIPDLLTCLIWWTWRTERVDLVLRTLSFTHFTSHFKRYWLMRVRVTVYVGLCCRKKWWSLSFLFCIFCLLFLFFADSFTFCFIGYLLFFPPAVGERDSEEHEARRH